MSIGSSIWTLYRSREDVGAGVGVGERRKREGREGAQAGEAMVREKRVELDKELEALKKTRGKGGAGIRG